MRTFLRSLAVLVLMAVSAAAQAARDAGPCDPPSVTGQTAICPNATVRLVAQTALPYGEWMCQWYRNGQPIPGEDDEELFVTEPGDYSALVIYPYCTSAPSAPFTVSPSVCAAAPAGLVLDPFANAGQSDGNGVLEPGERIVLGPSWLNSGTGPVVLAGNASNLVGPLGADYALFDGVADYGTIDAGTVGNCLSGTEDCYELAISNPPVRPEAHWDVSLQETPLNGDVPTVWKIHVGSSFEDVPISHPFYPEIEKLFHAGVTTGCRPSAFCPWDQGSKIQISIFLARATAGGDANVPKAGKFYDCSPGGTSMFDDVPPDDPFCPHVNFVASRGTFGNCDPPNLFCPGAPATRGQMALAVAREMAGGDDAIPIAYGPDPVTGLQYNCSLPYPDFHFQDLPEYTLLCRYAEYLRARGVIDGFPDGFFRPDLVITRGQMAKFLSNGFHLRLFGK